MAKPPIMQLPSMGTGRTTVLRKQFLQCINSNNFGQALVIAQQMHKLAPAVTQAMEDLAIAYLKLENWGLANKYALMVIAKQPNKINMLDVISHASGKLGDLAQLRTYGKLALELRASQNTQAVIAHSFDQQRFASGTKNLISFSLYGSSSKYCEPAVMNTAVVDSLYPGWVCRFYIDESVPAITVKRLTDNGAEVVMVSAAMKKWPAPMWRFAAYDDAQVSRVIFRDADSLINSREADALREWVEQDTQFHIMRDSGSHTELILAGMWGVKAGALPNMAQIIAHFLQKPVQNMHFADQAFLRKYVWPLAVNSNTHHDSLFGFGQHDFKVGNTELDNHVGYAEGIPVFSIATQLPKGCKVKWTCMHNDNGEGKELFSYHSVIKDKGILQAHIPRTYALLLNTGKVSIRYEQV